MRQKPTLLEISWITGILMFSYFTSIYLLRGQDFQNGLYDIAIHDTYFVVSPFSLSLMIFPLFAFIIFLIRILLQKAKNPATLISSSVCMVFSLFMLANLRGFLKMLIDSRDALAIYSPKSYKSSEIDTILYGTNVGIVLVGLLLCLGLMKLILPLVKK